MSAFWNNGFMTGITILVMKYTITCGEHRVYCQYKLAHIECYEGENIIINWAYYGRRSRTMCGQSEATSCNDESAMDTVIGKCSGRKECKLNVSHGFGGIFNNICPGVPLYAEVDFQCVKSSDIHSICDLSQTTRDHGLLASPNYPSNTWDGTTCSITISATAGHRLNVTFKDIKMSSGCDQTSLTLRSGSKSKTVCSTERTNDRFISETDKIAVNLKVVKDAKFLLEYKAIKCLKSDIRLPHKMTVKTVEEYSYAVLACTDSFVQDRSGPARLECRDNQWQGTTGECLAKDHTTLYHLDLTGTFELATTSKVGLVIESGEVKNTPGTATSVGLYIGIGSGIGVVAVLILATGIFLGLRRKRKPERRDASTQNTGGPEASTSIYLEMCDFRQANKPYETLQIPETGSLGISGQPSGQENPYQSLWTTSYGYNDAWSSRPGTCEKGIQTVDLDGVNPASVNVNVARSPTVQEILSRSEDSDSTSDSSTEYSDEWESDPSDTSAPELPPRSPLTYRDTIDSTSSGIVDNEIYTSGDAPDLIPQSRR